LIAGGRGRVLVVEHEADAGLGRLAADLPAVDVRRPYTGDTLPAGMGGHAGLIVLGGEMAAWDDDAAPWLPATRALIRLAVNEGMPVLGICLGAQLLALACGGHVQRGTQGLEVGLGAVQPLPGAPDDPLFAGVLSRLSSSGEAAPFLVSQYHRDAVTRLPDGALHLATGATYPHQAFRVGVSAWGVQYHPEVTTADFELWVRAGTDGLRAEDLDPERLEGAVQEATDALDRVARAHALAFADLVIGRSGNGHADYGVGDVFPSSGQPVGPPGPAGIH
jgi:GMP synthase (glutamine-hydrolysing)